jgi:uncharacterized protein HemX
MIELNISLIVGLVSLLITIVGFGKVYGQFKANQSQLRKDTDVQQKQIDSLNKDGSEKTRLLAQTVAALKSKIETVHPEVLGNRVELLENQNKELTAKVDSLSSGQSRMEGQLNAMNTSLNLILQKIGA